MIGKLPNFFNFRSSRNLIRIGRDNDGGYLISHEDIIDSDMLISLGISDDWSFESNFLKINKVPLLAFDASVGRKFFFRKIKKAIFRIYKPKIFFESLKKYRSYKNFFTGSSIHYEKYVGLESNNKKFITLESILKKIKNKKIFLKIDIEGSEYRLLDTLIKFEKIISGLAIEFHDCDLHLKKIEQFIKKFKLNLVHIHANNYGLLESINNLPLVLELTFSKNAKLNKGYKLPHNLDMPNNKDMDEIKLVISRS
jgi:hypothetical protein